MNVITPIIKKYLAGKASKEERLQLLEFLRRGEANLLLFQKAKEAICIGNHKIVSTYATDTIYLTNNYEEKISKKILSYL